MTEEPWWYDVGSTAVKLAKVYWQMAKMGNDAIYSGHYKLGKGVDWAIRKFPGEFKRDFTTKVWDPITGKIKGYDWGKVSDFAVDMGMLAWNFKPFSYQFGIDASLGSMFVGQEYNPEKTVVVGLGTILGYGVTGGSKPGGYVGGRLAGEIYDNWNQVKFSEQRPIQHAVMESMRYIFGERGSDTGLERDVKKVYRNAFQGVRAFDEVEEQHRKQYFEDKSQQEFLERIGYG